MKNRRTFLVALAFTLGWAGSAFAQQTAEELYQAGLYQEEVQGDLERAVEIYQTILNEHANNRAVAAKAQLHIGICYETLGLQEAQRAYERVVANYGEQSEVVGQARARLAALRQYATVAPAAGGPVARLLLDPANNPADRDIGSFRQVMPSPDGHRIAYVWGERVGVYIRDLATGKDELVASGRPPEVFMPPVWSADGKQLAFTVRDTVTKVNALKILDLSTRETRTVPMPAEGDAYLVDWTRDGRSFLYNDMNANSLRIMARDDGSVTTVADSVWPWQRATFSPDGRFVVYGYGGALGPRPICVQSVAGGPCHEIATSGEEMYPHPLWSPDGSAIAYQDDGGIWVVPMADGMPNGSPRLAYRTTAGRWAAAWTAAGGVHFTLFNQHNAPWRVEVDPSTGRVAGSGAEELADYPGGLRAFSWSPDGRRVAIVGWYTDLTIYSIDTNTSTSYGDLEQDGGVILFGGNWSPDGRELWYEHVSSSPGGARSVKAVDLATGQVRHLFAPTDGGRVSFSDDGRTMAFVRGRSESGPVEIVVAETGQADGRVVARVPGPDGAQLHPRVPHQISPQGDKVFYVVRQSPAAGSPGPAIWVVGADGTGARRVATAAGISSATWDPEGRLIAYAAQMTDTTGNVLRVVDVSTGADHELPVPNEDHALLVMDWSRDGRFIGYMRLETWWEYWAVQGLLNGER
jgi:Tol biopolymer transport system component